MGCLVKSDFVANYATFESKGLTCEEKEILKQLADAWNYYSEIEQKDSSLREFNDAIHRCQQLIALRVAKRIDPEIWV